MYRIIPERCSGCARCFEICPRQAIFMIDKVARIDDDRCNSCGRCLEVCRSHAIVKSANTMQKADGGAFVPAKTVQQEPAASQASLRPSLWIAALDLVAGISKTLLESNNRPVQIRSCNTTSPLQALPPESNRQRRRRRHGRNSSS